MTSLAQVLIATNTGAFYMCIQVKLSVSGNSQVTDIYPKYNLQIHTEYLI